MTRSPDRYPLPLPATPESLCRSCGAPVLGTRAGYVPFCERCASAGAAVEDTDAAPERAYRHPRAALRAAVLVLSQASGCPAVLPERDRVMGGEGSQRAERVAQASIVMAALDEAVPDHAWRDVVCAWAVGCTSPGGRYHQDSPYSWAWAARHTGTASVPRTHRIVGGLTRAIYARIRAAGLCDDQPGAAPAEEGGRKVYTHGDEFAYGWDGVVDCLAALGLRPGGPGSTISIRTARRWAKDKGLPVVKDGALRMEVAAARKWLREGGAQEEGRAA